MAKRPEQDKAEKPAKAGKADKPAKGGKARKAGQAAADTRPDGAAVATRAAEREARRAANKAEREAATAARRAANQAARAAARAERGKKAAGNDDARARGKTATPATSDTADDGPGAASGRASAERAAPAARPARSARGARTDAAASSMATATSPGDPPSAPETAARAPRGRRKSAPRAAGGPAATPDFDILVVAQGGGIDRQAAFLATSLRRNAPGFRGRIIVAEPQPGGAWDDRDPRMSDAARRVLGDLGADIRPLHARDFGQSYPHGNKIEALSLLDAGRPFLFLDSDTLVLGDIGAVPFDFSRPSASMRRTGTWPEPPAYKQTYDSIWRSLYDRFGLDMDATLDRAQPEEHWERFLYFNAGWFFGADPAEFARRFRDWAVAVREDPGEPLACQSLDPWLDQVVLPLVVHSFGGGRPGPELDGMDGDVTCHWRNLPLLYARESQRAVDEIEAIAALPGMAGLMEGWEAGQRLIRDGLGRRRVRPMFAADDPPPPEQALRHRLRQADLWLV